MARLLVMAERAVTEMERAAYLQTLAVRRERAAAASANFWVFERQDGRGHFLEFVEAGSQETLDAAIAAVAEGNAMTGMLPVVWREASALN
ncbi:MAG: hypothetical protein ACO1Q7_02825 [Gemmatimonas sp.]